MDLEALQRFRSQSDLLGYLSTRIAHEDSTRQLHWSIIALYSGLLVVVFGAAAAVVVGSVARSDALWTIAAVFASLAFCSAFVTLVTLLVLIRAQYVCLLHRTRDIIEWWNDHSAEQRTEAGNIENLDFDERAILIMNLASVADSLFDDNRSRARFLNVAKVATIISVILVLVASAVYITSVWRFNDVNDRSQQRAQEGSSEEARSGQTEQAEATSNTD